MPQSKPELVKLGHYLHGECIDLPHSGTYDNGAPPCLG